MSVYDLSREQAERLAGLLLDGTYRTTVLKRADGQPMRPYDVWCFARDLADDAMSPHEQHIAKQLSFGEHQLLTIAASLTDLGSRVEALDHTLRLEVAECLRRIVGRLQHDAAIDFGLQYRDDLRELYDAEVERESCPDSSLLAWGAALLEQDGEQ